MSAFSVVSAASSPLTLVDASSAWSAAIFTCSFGFAVLTVLVLAVIVILALVTLLLLRLLVEADGFFDFLPKSEGLFALARAAGGLELITLLARVHLSFVSATAVIVAVAIIIAVAIAPTLAAIAVPVPVPVAISVPIIAAVAVVLILFRHCLLSVRMLEPGRPPQDNKGKV